MADAVKVDVVGLRPLIKELRTAGVDLDELKEATAAASRIVLAAAAAGAPRKTGNLAGSGRQSKNRRKAVITFGNARVPYAGPIHWGWRSRNIAANPFVSRAVQATEPVWVKAYVDELEKIVSQIRGAS